MPEGLLRNSFCVVKTYFYYSLFFVLTGFINLQIDTIYLLIFFLIFIFIISGKLGNVAFVLLLVFCVTNLCNFMK